VYKLSSIIYFRGYVAVRKEIVLLLFVRSFVWEFVTSGNMESNLHAKEAKTF
jgi:hypothetical protein